MSSTVQYPLQLEVAYAPAIVQGYPGRLILRLTNTGTGEVSGLSVSLRWPGFSGGEIRWEAPQGTLRGGQHIESGVMEFQPERAGPMAVRYSLELEHDGQRVRVSDRPADNQAISPTILAGHGPSRSEAMILKEVGVTGDSSLTDVLDRALPESFARVQLNWSMPAATQLARTLHGEGSGVPPANRGGPGEKIPLGGTGLPRQSQPSAPPEKPRRPGPSTGTPPRPQEKRPPTTIQSETGPVPIPIPAWPIVPPVPVPVMPSGPAWPDRRYPIEPPNNVRKKSSAPRWVALLAVLAIGAVAVVVFWEKSYKADAPGPQAQAGAPAAPKNPLENLESDKLPLEDMPSSPVKTGGVKPVAPEPALPVPDAPEKPSEIASAPPEAPESNVPVPVRPTPPSPVLPPTIEGGLPPLVPNSIVLPEPAITAEEAAAREEQEVISFARKWYENWRYPRSRAAESITRISRRGGSAVITGTALETDEEKYFNEQGGSSIRNEVVSGPVLIERDGSRFSVSSDIRHTHYPVHLSEPEVVEFTERLDIRRDASGLLKVHEVRRTDEPNVLVEERIREYVTAGNSSGGKDLSARMDFWIDDDDPDGPARFRALSGKTAIRRILNSIQNEYRYREYTISAPVSVSAQGHDTWRARFAITVKSGTSRYASDSPFTNPCEAMIVRRKGRFLLKSITDFNP